MFYQLSEESHKFTSEIQKEDQIDSTSVKIWGLTSKELAKINFTGIGVVTTNAKEE